VDFPGVHYPGVDLPSSFSPLSFVIVVHRYAVAFEPFRFFAELFGDSFLSERHKKTAPADEPRWSRSAMLSS
jgi:hypothetical protein